MESKIIENNPEFTSCSDIVFLSQDGDLNDQDKTNVEILYTCEKAFDNACLDNTIALQSSSAEEAANYIKQNCESVTEVDVKESGIALPGFYPRVDIQKD